MAKQRRTSEDIPGSVETPAGVRATNSYEKALTAYFNSLVISPSTATKANTAAEEGANREELMAIYEPDVAKGDKKLTVIEKAALLKGFRIAYNQLNALFTIRGSVTKAEGAALFLKPTSFKDYVIQWAFDNSATMVTEVSLETQRRLAKLTSDVVAQGGGVPALQRAIRAEFDDMAEHRPELIAQTELNKAFSQGGLDSGLKHGMNFKSWITVGDSRVRPEHTGNQAQGRINIFVTFSNGEFIPGEPNCRCVVAYWKTKTGRL